MLTGVLLLLSGAYSALMSGGSYANLLAAVILTPALGDAPGPGGGTAGGWEWTRIR